MIRALLGHEPPKRTPSDEPPHRRIHAKLGASNCQNTRRTGLPRIRKPHLTAFDPLDPITKEEPGALQERSDQPCWPPSVTDWNFLVSSALFNFWPHTQGLQKSTGRLFFFFSFGGSSERPASQPSQGPSNAPRDRANRGDPHPSRGWLPNTHRQGDRRAASRPWTRILLRGPAADRPADSTLPRPTKYALSSTRENPRA